MAQPVPGVLKQVQSSQPAKLTEASALGEYKTITESEWGATVKVEKGGKLSIEIAEYDEEGSADRRTLVGKWKITDGLLILTHGKAEDRYQFYPKNKEELVTEPVDVLLSLKSSHSALDSQKLYRVPFKIAGAGLVKENEIKTKNSAIIELANPRVTLTFPILKSAKLSDPENEIYFDGVKPCAAKNPTGMTGLNLTHIGKCLSFHTQFSADRWSQTPIAILKSADRAAIKQDLEKIYKSNSIQVEQGKTDKYAWGEVYNWNTQTSGSAHYMYLSHRDKKLVLRIGPIAGSVLVNYNFDFKKAEWKFN